MPSRLSGTSWHVGYLKSDDGRRHKSRCIYYEGASCKYRGNCKCIGSSHCSEYKESEKKREKTKKNKKLDRSNIDLYKKETIDKNGINIGSKIILEDLETREILKLQLVHSGKEDILEGKISVDSPIGVEAMGKKKRDKIVIHKSTSYESSFRINKVDR